jgi:DNA polymerase I-like protein with 3'-5' exonuclease and polymerase domains
LKSLSQELDKDIKTLEATILRLQVKIQFSFSKQLGDILFEKLKLGGPKQKENEDWSICNRRRNSKLFSKRQRNSFNNIRLALINKTSKHLC